MHTSSIIKKEFLKKWIKGLQICCSSKKKMNLIERKKRIKLSADIAMVFTKKTPTSWSNALISKAKNNKQDNILVSELLGSDQSPLKLQRTTNRITNVSIIHKRVQCKKILKRSCFSVGNRRMKDMGTCRSNLGANIIAKRLVKKRIKVLERLVPGGESMDEFSLIKEAMDYILSLKVQVDVMRSVVASAEVIN